MLNYYVNIDFITNVFQNGVNWIKLAQFVETK